MIERRVVGLKCRYGGAVERGKEKKKKREDRRGRVEEKEGKEKRNDQRIRE
jgi:hypothetical protein